MSDMRYAESPAWPVVSVREVRAASADEAAEISEEEIAGQQRVDTGEAGHTATGTVIGVLNDEPIDFYMEGLTANQSLREAALLLLAASFQEGDDGTGGVQTEEDIQTAIDVTTEVLQTMKEARS